MTAAPEFPPFVTKTGEPRCIHLGCPEAQAEGPTHLCMQHVGFALTMSDMHRRWVDAQDAADMVGAQLTAVALIEAALNNDQELVSDLIDSNDPGLLAGITAYLGAALARLTGDPDVIARLRLQAAEDVDKDDQQ